MQIKFFPAALFMAVALIAANTTFDARYASAAQAEIKAAAPTTEVVKKTAPSLKDLEGMWQADINATAKRFKVFPTELKNSLSGATFNITAANSRMQLKWKDGTVLNRTLKLVSAKGGVYALKVDGQHDLSIDASQKDTLILIENPNSIVLKRVPPAAPAATATQAK